MNYVQKMFLTAKRVAMGSADVDVDAPPFVGLSDCSACPNPCDDDDHPHYPSYLKINQTMPLLHSVKSYERHVLISTGKEDWDSHIDNDKSSLAFYLQNAIDKGQQRLRDSGSGQTVYRIVLTNSSRMADTWDGPGWQVVVLPDQLVVNNVTPEQCDDFFEAFLAPPVETFGQGVTESNGDGTVTQSQDNTAPSQESSTGPSASTGGVQSSGSPLTREVRTGKTTFVAHRWQAKAAVMICSHKKRDKRCGVTAAILKKEFTRILRSKDLLGDAEGDVEIWL
ncbi:hypothetical protein BGX24_003623, partial [Mortierella sp. AD032]